MKKLELMLDPRFDGLSGKFNYDLYRKSYRFIEEKQEEEINELKQNMFKETNGSKKKRIQLTSAS